MSLAQIARMQLLIWAPGIVEYDEKIMPLICGPNKSFHLRIMKLCTDHPSQDTYQQKKKTTDSSSNIKDAVIPPPPFFPVSSFSRPLFHFVSPTWP
jgi:hypothetical protein